jgi:hypothetical protein
VARVSCETGRCGHFGTRQHSIVQRLLKAPRKKAAEKLVGQEPLANLASIAALICKKASGDVDERLPVGVADNVAAGHLVDAPGRRKAAWRVPPSRHSAKGKPLHRLRGLLAASPAALGYLGGPRWHTVVTNRVLDQGAAMKNHDPVSSTYSPSSIEPLQSGGHAAHWLFATPWQHSVALPNPRCTPTAPSYPIVAASMPPPSCVTTWSEVMPV